MSSELLRQKALALIKRDKEFHALRQQHARALGWLEAVDELSRIPRRRDLADLFEQWPLVMVRHVNIQCAALFETDRELRTLELVSQAGSAALDAQKRVLGQAARQHLQQEEGVFNDPNQHPVQREIGLVRFFWSLARLTESKVYLLVAGYDSTTFSFFPRLDEPEQAYYRMMSKNLESLASNLTTITDLQRLNSDLEEKETRFRTLFEKIPTGLVVTSPEHKIIHANKTFRRYTGYTADELTGLTIRDLTHPEDFQDTSVLIRQVMDGVRDGFEVTKRYLRKDKSEFIANSLVTAHRGPRGEVVELFAVIEDITEQREAEIKLAALEHEFRHAQKLEALGRLAGGVAHDFNNLLTVIIGNTHFVTDELPANDERRTDLQEVLRAADSATELTGQLLSFSRRRVARTTVFEINTALRQIHKMLRRTLREAIELVLLPAEESFFVRFSVSQFEQLIFNLAVNAQHAMSSGGELTIAITEERVTTSSNLVPGDYVRIVVTDTGCGMTPQDLERAFEPFFTTKGEDGTGLGLSTCYGIVKHAGGAIKIASRVNKGTSVSIHLPRVARPVDEPIDKKTVRCATTRRGTVLAVEDQSAILQLMVRALESSGYVVVAARTAEQACAMVERDNPALDFLVTDVVLPGFSGVELSRVLRAKYPELRVVLTSGYPGEQCSSIEDGDELMSFLSKPFSADQLIGAVSLLGATESTK